LDNIEKICKPRCRMDGKIQNRTLSVYQSISASAAGIYIVAVQSLYELFNWRFSDNPLANVLFNIVIGGVLYIIILKAIIFIKMRLWMKEYNECYMGGTWYHIHTKEDDGQYIRAGRVRIKQHFFDISVEGENYTPELIMCEGKDTPEIRFGNRRKMTQWRYILSNISDGGELIACYSAGKKTSNNRSNRGLHEMMVIEHDKFGYPLIIRGTFSDVYPSTSEGYIELFRSQSRGRKDAVDTSDAPQAWVEAVAREMMSKKVEV